LLLELKDITKSFFGVDGDVEVLRGVSLELDAGQTLALTGESGSGKSTVLHISAGLEVPDDGSLHLEGIEINGLGEAERANL
jgi:ABC-type antimicrobial peptide transport system, ATPase component